jgi:hypothetical protein
MTRKVGHPYPIRDEEASVVSQQMNVRLPLLGRPADEPISRSQVTGSGTEGETSDRPLGGKDQVLKVLSDRMTVTEVVVVLDEAAVEPFKGGPADLLYLQRTELLDGTANRGLVDGDPKRFRAREAERIRGVLSLLRELKQPLPM